MIYLYRFSTMDLFRKFMIVGIVILTIYILYNLYETRKKILLNMLDETTLVQEGLTQTAADKEAAIMKDGFVSTPGISNVDSVKYGNLPLREFCIKSSYNSAVSGQHVSTDCLMTVLSRGCRFIDLEVYFISDDTSQGPYVAFTTDPTFTTISSQSKVSLSEMLNVLVRQAFSGIAPNQKDPIFLQIRMKTHNPALYNLVGMNIKKTLGGKLYPDPVSGATLLNDVMGKIILIMDKQTDPNYLDLSNYPNCTGKGSDLSNNSCFILSKFANVESGGDTLNIATNQILTAQPYSPPAPSDDGSGKSTVVAWRIVEPDTMNTANAMDNSKLVKNYGAQILGYNFNQNDKNLQNYETFFRDNNAAMVPISVAIPYIKKQES
jgi:Phosphatidylinositol-specific phospholipase C, X domain